MLRVDDEERCRLKSEIEEARKDLDDCLKYGDGDLVKARTRLNRAYDNLSAWESTITQVFSPPAGMIAVFEREDGMEEYLPVVYLALHHSGKVLPYVMTGNCESRVPSDFPNFLRIDRAETMAGEVPFEFMATEHNGTKQEPRPRATRQGMAVWAPLSV